jgi:hypothetical protein
MRTILLFTLALTAGCSAAQAVDSSISPVAEGSFTAVSLTESEGVRAIISNVIELANATSRSSCEATVRFFGADGALIGQPKNVQLKPGESLSVAASNPPRLVRAAVSVDHTTDLPQQCALKTSLEIFDVRTGTTFVSIPGEFTRGSIECVPTAPGPAVAAKTTPKRASPGPLATSSTSGSAKRPTDGTPVFALSRPSVQNGN